MRNPPVGRVGLYRPEFEHDACGVGFVCDAKNHARHDIVTDGAQLLNNLIHRGAAGADPTTGDGAGILIQLPHELFSKTASCELPEPGRYGVGMCFLPQGEVERNKVRQVLEEKLRDAGLSVLCWREVPVDSAILNDFVRTYEPVMEQVFVSCPEDMTQDMFELKLYLVRRWVSQEAKRQKIATDDPAGYYIPSMSSRTIVYKGMFLADQIIPYYADLSDTRAKSAVALVHQRFFDQHLPVLEACPPLSRLGPQRRDKHLARQHQQHAFQAKERFQQHVWKRADDDPAPCR